MTGEFNGQVGGAVATDDNDEALSSGDGGNNIAVNYVHDNTTPTAPEESANHTDNQNIKNAEDTAATIGWIENEIQSGIDPSGETAKVRKTIAEFCTRYGEARQIITKNDGMRDPLELSPIEIGDVQFGVDQQELLLAIVTSFNNNAERTLEKMERIRDDYREVERYFNWFRKLQSPEDLANTYEGSEDAGRYKTAYSGALENIEAALQNLGDSGYIEYSNVSKSGDAKAVAEPNFISNPLAVARAQIRECESIVDTLEQKYKRTLRLEEIDSLFGQAMDGLNARLDAADPVAAHSDEGDELAEKGENDAPEDDDTGADNPDDGDRFVINGDDEDNNAPADSDSEHDDSSTALGNPANKGPF